MICDRNESIKTVTLDVLSNITKIVSNYENGSQLIFRAYKNHSLSHKLCFFVSWWHLTVFSLKFYDKNESGSRGHSS